MNEEKEEYEEEAQATRRREDEEDEILLSSRKYGTGTYRTQGRRRINNYYDWELVLLLVILVRGGEVVEVVSNISLNKMSWQKIRRNVNDEICFLYVSLHSYL